MTLWKFLKSTGTSTFGWYIDDLSWLVFLLKKHHGFLDRGCMKTRSNWIGLISSRVKLHPVFLCYEILREMIDSEKTHPNLGAHTCVPHLFWKPNSSGNLIPQTNYNLASLLLFYNDDLKKKHPTNTIDGPSPPKTKALKIVSNETSGIHLSGIHLEHGHTIRILFLNKNAQDAAPWEAKRATPRPHMGSYYCRRKKITSVNPSSLNCPRHCCLLRFMNSKRWSGQRKAPWQMLGKHLSRHIHKQIS